MIKNRGVFPIPDYAAGRVCRSEPLSELHFPQGNMKRACFDSKMNIGTFEGCG